MKSVLPLLDHQSQAHLCRRAPAAFTAQKRPFRLNGPKSGEETGFTLRDARLSAGAGFVVALCGDIMTMPGLPKVPAADRIGLDERGQIMGLRAATVRGTFAAASWRG